ncbi:hypothetical protein GW750_00335 [bacterium]|nr:hypothetical protein [bacterium]
MRRDMRLFTMLVLSAAALLSVFAKSCLRSQLYIFVFFRSSTVIVVLSAVSLVSAPVVATLSIVVSPVVVSS